MTGQAANVPTDIADWNAVWLTVAATLARDKFVPKFLTEDGIRYATLHAVGVYIDVVQRAETEYPAASLGGDQLGRLDLVIRLGTAATVIEFKYPREPRQKLPPWPDHLGGVLSDTYRLGMLAARSSTERCIQVLVASASFLGYVERTMTRLELATYESGSRLPRKILLTPDRVRGLADTTRRQLKERDKSWEVTARSITLADISGKGLWLGAYDITAVTATMAIPRSANVAGQAHVPGTVIGKQ
jgi:hypothetical protein